MSSPRVLVIDDSPPVVAALTEALRMDGCDVNGLSSFANLVSMLEEFEPEVIVLDLLMPGFNGLQFARFIERYCDKPPPIILHSGSDPELLRIAAQKIRPYAVVPKGMGLRDIRRVVARAIAFTRGWGSGDASVSGLDVDEGIED